MYNQPPDWSAAGGTFGKQINDPRWTGAVREDFPVVGSGMMPEVAFRGLYAASTKLYLSFQTLVDDGSTPGFDAVYVGFASSATAARVLKITLQTGAALSGDLTPGNRTLETWQWNGTSWTSTGLPDAWATGDPNAVGLWIDSSANTWSVNTSFDTSAASALGTALGGAVTKVWFQVARYHAAFPSDVLTARHKWPYTSDQFDESAGTITNDVTKWATLHFGTSDPACPSGISIVPEHIGTTPVTSGVPSDTIYWNTTTASNTFIAVPTYPGATPAAGTIKGSFRIADWGSQIGDSSTDWKNILPSPGTVDSDGTGNISWPCTGAACPQLAPGALTDQCMLVELFGGNSGGQPVHFIHDSARRNMRFVHLSRFQSNARISVVGLPPLPSTTHRDVYIFVKTHNMEEKIAVKNRPPDLAAVLRDPPPIGRGKGNPTGGQVDAGQTVPAYQPPFYERVSSVLPTYEVHVYHTTGREKTVGSKTFREIEPQAPFGYFALHDTTPDGWKHTLEGVGVTLETVGPNLYHVKVPNNGSVLVNTKIETIEAQQCSRFLGVIRCCCNLAQTHEGAELGVFAFLGLAALITFRRRSKPM